MLAIFDTNAGFLQWLGEADGHPAAILALHKDVGLWEASADRADVEASADEDSLRVIEVTSEQANALQAWADGGAKSPDYPEGLDRGVVYTHGEIFAMLGEQ